MRWTRALGSASGAVALGSHASATAPSAATACPQHLQGGLQEDFSLAKRTTFKKRTSFSTTIYAALLMNMTSMLTRVARLWNISRVLRVRGQSGGALHCSSASRTPHHSPPLPSTLVALLLLVLCSSDGSTTSPFAAAHCQKGAQFFNDRVGSCQPCTRCHQPQIVIIPCYEYQDTECAIPEDHLEVKGGEESYALPVHIPSQHNPTSRDHSKGTNDSSRGRKRNNKRKKKKKNKKRKKNRKNNRQNNAKDPWRGTYYNPLLEVFSWDDEYESLPVQQPDGSNEAEYSYLSREDVQYEAEDTRIQPPGHLSEVSRQRFRNNTLNSTARNHFNISQINLEHPFFESGSPHNNSGDTKLKDKSLIDSLEIRQLLLSGWTAALVLCVLLLLALLAVALVLLLIIQLAMCAKNKIAAALKEKPPSSDDDPSSCVLMKQLGPASLAEKPRNLAKGLGRIPRKVHVARTYKPGLDKLDKSHSDGRRSLQLTQSTNTMFTDTYNNNNNNSGSSFSTESHFDSLSSRNVSAYSKETAFNSSTMPSRLSIKNSYKTPTRRYAPPNCRVLYPTKEEVVCPTEKAPNPPSRAPSPLSGVVSEVNSVVTNNIVTFGDGSTLSTTTNYSPNAATNLSYPYTQTLPPATTYVCAVASPGDSNATAAAAPSAATTTTRGGVASTIVNAPTQPHTFPAAPESKGSPIPYTMDRLLEQRRRLGCASSVDTNIYVEMWRGSSAAPSNNPSAAPSPALRRNNDRPSTSGGPEDRLEDNRPVDSFIGRPSVGERYNMAVCDTSAPLHHHNHHRNTRSSSPRTTSVQASRLANRLTAHLASQAGSPGPTVRHFR